MVLPRDKKKLHWVAKGKQSDWDGVPAKKQNLWQKVATKTHGFVTIGNLTSALGFYLVVAGLYNFAEELAVIGVIQVLIGRILDYLDGMLADLTRTKSTVGALIDATLDTFELVLALVILVHLDVLPLPLAIALAIPKSLNTIGYTAARARSKRINTTGDSKVATALLWMSLGFYMVHDMIEGVSAVPFDVIGFVFMIAAIVLTIPASIEYLQVGFTSKKQS